MYIQHHLNGEGGYTTRYKINKYSSLHKIIHFIGNVYAHVKFLGCFGGIRWQCVCVNLLPNRLRNKQRIQDRPNGRFPSVCEFVYLTSNFLTTWKLGLSFKGKRSHNYIQRQNGTESTPQTLSRTLFWNEINTESTHCNCTTQFHNAVYLPTKRRGWTSPYNKIVHSHNNQQSQSIYTFSLRFLGLVPSS